MSNIDHYDLPEIVVTPDSIDPTKAITYDQESDQDKIKKALAEKLAQQIAEEEDQSGVRSSLRDVFNSDSAIGLDNPDPPPPPSTTPLQITIGTQPIVNPATDDNKQFDETAPVGTPSTGSSLVDTFDYAGEAPDAVSGAAPLPTTDSLVSAEGENAPVSDPLEATKAALANSRTAQLVDQSTRGIRQMARGALSTTGAAPWTMVAGAAALPGAIGELLGIGRPAWTDKAVQYLQGRAENNKRFAEDVTGLSGDAAKPQNLVEEVSKLLGENLTPIKGATVPATLISAGINSLFTPAEAKTKKNVDAVTQAGQDQTVIETIGGPARVNNAELYTLGGIVAGSLGMIFLPKVFRAFKTGSVPALRPVENAAPGTQAMSTSTDLARTYDDANAGALRLLRRTGIDPATMAIIQRTFDVQTRANAHALVDSAIQMGRMETANFQFQARTPLLNIAKQETPQLREYLHLRDAFDEIQQIQKKAGPNAGPSTLRGMTDTDVLRQLHTLERAHPELRATGVEYRDNLKAVRKFASTGEFATMSKAEYTKANAERPNTTQFGKVNDDPRTNLGSPTDNLATHMHKELRFRMENEAKGQYVDAIRRQNPRLMVRISPEQLRKNDAWKRNVVEIYRRGKRELYTTDQLLADVLRMDPYQLTTMSGQTFYGLRRALETTTTGRFAPWFSPVSATRNYFISKYTTPKGLKAPTIFGSVYAIPHQLAPKLAKAISEGLDRGSGQWLTKVFGQAAVNNMSVRLGQEWQKSLVAQMQAAGTTRASILENQTQALTRLQHASNTVTGPMKAMLHGYEELLHAIHNAPMHDFARRNRGKLSNVDLAKEARHLTGSPKVAGAYYSGSFSGTGRPLPIDMSPAPTSWHTNVVTHKMAKIWGGANQLANEMVPWHNVTVQGMKRIAEAYTQNPARFVMKTWQYSMMPAASLYFFARSLGSDPNGVDYVDYMMNRRSDYQKQMYAYIPIPGKPVEEGIEMPLFHELAPTYRLMQIAMDHTTRSSIFTEKEDFQKAAAAFFNTAIEPPIPPIMSILPSSMGYSVPMGAFGGDLYRKKTDPYDQTAGLTGSLETLARATAGGIADIAGHGYAAYTQTPEGTIASTQNAVKQMGRRIIEKTPFVRDVMNIHPAIGGSSLVTEALFAKNAAINNLSRFFDTYGDTGDRTVNIKPASIGGGRVANLVLGEGMPADEAGKTGFVGLRQPPPTNPLYIKFMKEIRDTFKKDDPTTGGVGYRSMWRRYADLGTQIQGMRNINTGNYVTWQKQLAKMREDLPWVDEYLNEYKVDTKNPQAVRSFFERQRQDVARHLLFSIRGVEDKLSKEVGRPVKIEDLDPYSKGGSSGSLLPDPTAEMDMSGPLP